MKPTPAQPGLPLQFVGEALWEIGRGRKPVVIAVLMDSKERDLKTRLQSVEAAARTLGRQIVIVKAGDESELEAAFAMVVQGGAGALFVSGSAFFTSKHRQIVALAIRHAVPAIYPLREYVVASP
jgi:putative ABC transport system substrate-binding protein